MNKEIEERPAEQLVKPPTREEHGCEVDRQDFEPCSEARFEPPSTGLWISHDSGESWIS